MALLQFSDGRALLRCALGHRLNHDVATRLIEVIRSEVVQAELGGSMVAPTEEGNEQDLEVLRVSHEVDQELAAWMR